MGSGSSPPSLFVYTFPHGNLQDRNNELGDQRFQASSDGIVDMLASVRFLDYILILFLSEISVPNP